ncbi:hypothetical protein [uncultured Paludibaculum sp.]|uniref:hypothetical protein n=1 Tax=uncultured Paludibaculum sp. TaxID=1765020 RepID=UPI002AAB31F7|nr:hypothetical protein [uncultured Paludibaculum sp.]
MKSSVRNAIVRLLLAGALFAAVALANVPMRCIGGHWYVWTSYGWVYSGGTCVD